MNLLGGKANGGGGGPIGPPPEMQMVPVPKKVVITIIYDTEADAAQVSGIIAHKGLAYMALERAKDAVRDYDVTKQSKLTAHVDPLAIKGLKPS